MSERAQLNRRRLILASLLATASLALVQRQTRAVHIAWEAYLQEGTCASPTTGSRTKLGDPTYGVPVGVSGTPVGTPPIQHRVVGSSPVFPVVTSTATIDTALADLLASPYSITLESIDLESEERMVIACGNVGGVPTDGEIVFGLGGGPVDTTGVAWLHETADDVTEITLFIAQGLSSIATDPGHTAEPGTPAAGGVTPAEETPAASAAATEVTIGSYDIYFDPKEVTIAADIDVTIRLPSHGVTLHNFSITDHNQFPGVPNLGIDVDLPAGATETITVNAPAGDYYYYCNVPGHEAAGMFGTMHVV